MSKFIKIVPSVIETNPQVYYVVSKKDAREILGTIKLLSDIKRIAFIPDIKDGGTWWTSECLKQILDFLSKLESSGKGETT